MPVAGVYQLFISHAWTYGDAYDRLLDLLNKAPDFYFSDYSVPKDDPIHYAAADHALRLAIQSRVAPAEVILVLAGVYATYSKWINEEVYLAQRAFYPPKPIVAVEPWGAEKTSQFVKDNATLIVGWNTNSVVSKITSLVGGPGR